MDIEQIESKISRRPHSPLFARLAEKYLSSGKASDARYLCLSGLEKYPSYSTAYYILAKTFEEERNFSAALESIKLALSFNPDSTTFINLRSKLETNSFITSEQSSGLPLLEQIDIVKEVTEQSKLDATIEEIEVTPAEKTELPVEQIEIEQEHNLETFIPQEIIQPEEERSIIDTLSDLTVSSNVTTKEDVDISQMDTHTDIEKTQVNEFEGRTVQGSKEVDSMASGTDQFTNIKSEDAKLPENAGGIINEPPVDIQQEISDETTSLESKPIEQESEIISPSLNEQQLPSITEKLTEEQEPEFVHLETTIPIEPLAQNEPTEDVEEYHSTNQQNDEGRLVSKTLAEIYATQGEYHEAITTYQLLKQIRPHMMEEINRRIIELEKIIQAKSGQTKPQ